MGMSSSQPHPLQMCRWGSCRVKCPTATELLTHVVDEHLSCLPVRGSGVKGQTTHLICEWRGCIESGRVFGARYKLLVHVQNNHCHSQVCVCVLTLSLQYSFKRVYIYICAHGLTI